MKTPSAQVRVECRELLHGIRDDLELLRYESVLVTGGTGFMGTWLAELLTCANDELDLGVRLHLLSENASDFKDRAPHLASRKDVFLIERDVRMLGEISNEVGWIVHAAGSPDTRLHVSEPMRVLQTIVNGTMTTLTAAVRLPNLKKFLNISSGLIYGPQQWEQEAIPETHLGKVDCSSYAAVYPEAKRMAETVCAVFRSQSRLPVVNVRPFAFIGPYLNLERAYAVTNFLRDALQGGPIRIVGDGETVRSYLYGGDMAAWLVVMLIRGVIGTSYNLGSPDEVTLRSLAEKISQAFPEPRRVLINPAGSLGKRSRWIPDIKRAEDLGLRASVNLRRAIERTLSWHTSAIGKTSRLGDGLVGDSRRTRSDLPGSPCE